MDTAADSFKSQVFQMIGVQLSLCLNPEKRRADSPDAGQRRKLIVISV